MTLTLQPHDLDRRDPTLVLRGRVIDENKNPVKYAAVEPFGIRIGDKGLQGGRGLYDPLAVTNDRGEFRLGVTEKGAKQSRRSFLTFPVVWASLAAKVHPSARGGPYE